MEVSCEITRVTTFGPFFTTLPREESRHTRTGTSPTEQGTRYRLGPPVEEEFFLYSQTRILSTVAFRLSTKTVGTQGRKGFDVEGLRYSKRTSCFWVLRGTKWQLSVHKRSGKQRGSLTQNSSVSFTFPIRDYNSEDFGGTRTERSQQIYKEVNDGSWGSTFRKKQTNKLSWTLLKVPNVSFLKFHYKDRITKSFVRRTILE